MGRKIAALPRRAGHAHIAVEQVLHAEGAAREVLATVVQALFQQQHGMSGRRKLVGRDGPASAEPITTASTSSVSPLGMSQARRVRART